MPEEEWHKCSIQDQWSADGCAHSLMSWWDRGSEPMGRWCMTDLPLRASPNSWIRPVASITWPLGLQRGHFQQDFAVTSGSVGGEQSDYYGLWEPRCIKQAPNFLEIFFPGREERICDWSVPDRKEGILLERCAVTADKMCILPVHAASLSVSACLWRQPDPAPGRDPKAEQGENSHRGRKRCHVMLLVRKKKTHQICYQRAEIQTA